jgi:hypothetical protein
VNVDGKRVLQVWPVADLIGGSATTLTPSVRFVHQGGLAPLEFKDESMSAMWRDSVRRRRPAQRESRRRMLVYCGAARIEPDCSNRLKSPLRTPAVTVAIRQEGVDPALEPTGTGHDLNPSTNVEQR